MRKIESISFHDVIINDCYRDNSIIRQIIHYLLYHRNKENLNFESCQWLYCYGESYNLAISLEAGYVKNNEKWLINPGIRCNYDIKKRSYNEKEDLFYIDIIKNIKEINKKIEEINAFISCKSNEISFKNSSYFEESAKLQLLLYCNSCNDIFLVNEINKENLCNSCYQHQFNGYESLVYFIKLGKYLKIGWTSDIIKRLKTHNDFNKLIEQEDIKIYNIIDGSRLLEFKYHQKYKNHRCSKKEYFNPEKEVLEEIKLLKTSQRTEIEKVKNKYEWI